MVVHLQHDQVRNYVHRHPVPSQDHIQFMIKEDHIKILGFYMGADGVKTRDLLWSEISKMKRCLNYCKFCDLKWKGKVIVVNSVISSKNATMDTRSAENECDSCENVLSLILFGFDFGLPLHCKVCLVFDTEANTHWKTGNFVSQ